MSQAGPGGFGDEVQVDVEPTPEDEFSETEIVVTAVPDDEDDDTETVV